VATGILLRITDTTSGQSWERRFDHFPVRIGRSPISNLRLDHSFVSQFHAVLELHGTSLMLRDLGSTNGTALRGEGRVPPNQLVDLGVGQRNHGFAIASLEIQAFPLQVDQPGHDGSPVVQGGDTAYVRVANHEHPTTTAYVDPLAGKDAALDSDYQAYRLAWARLHRQFYQQLCSVDPAHRARFFHSVARSRPEMAAEPEFQSLAKEFGITLPRTESAQALDSVRELAARYVPSHPPNDAQSTAAFLGKVRDTLDVFFECFIPLRDGYQEFRASMAVRKNASPDAAQNPCVEAAKTPKELASCMLDWTADSSTSGAVASTFADVMIHHVAMLNGVMMGVNCLLSELSPQLIARSCEKRMGRRLFGQTPSYKLLWGSFVERFSDLADEQNETFRLVFGPDFAAAYRRFQQDASRQRDGSPDLPPPSLPDRARMAQGDEHSSAFVPAVPNPIRR